MEERIIDPQGMEMYIKQLEQDKESLVKENEEFRGVIEQVNLEVHSVISGDYISTKDILKITGDGNLDNAYTNRKILLSLIKYLEDKIKEIDTRLDGFDIQYIQPIYQDILNKVKENNYE